MSEARRSRVSPDAPAEGDLGDAREALDVGGLMDRCIAGEEGAWDELYRLYQPQALVFLRRLGVDREAEDATQEVFVQVFRYLPRFERRAEFRTWLYKLCVSQAARARRRALLTRPLRWLRGGPEPAVPPEWSEGRMAAVAERALGEMSAPYRTVFVLFELEGLSTEEIGRVLGWPGGTVRSRLHKARRRFEAFLRDEDGPAEGDPHEPT
jgi:RNA polymerase sigma-70 factor (ECF subfamily)